MDEKQMRHGIDYQGGDVAGHIATEKFNGCRAYWDGLDLWSRGGLKISLPKAWRDALPEGVHMDGELYDGPGGVYRCGGAIRYGRFTDTMRLMVFDCPQMIGSYTERLAFARSVSRGPVVTVDGIKITSLPEAVFMLRSVMAAGGEGVVLHRDDCLYTPGRTTDVIKFKYLREKAGVALPDGTELAIPRAEIVRMYGPQKWTRDNTVA